MKIPPLFSVLLCSSNLPRTIIGLNRRDFVNVRRFASNAVSLSELLSAATRSDSFLLEAQVHGHGIKLGLADDVFFCNNLIRMYSKVGTLDVGIKLFDEMHSRNLVSWTLAISAVIHDGDVDVGFEYFVDTMRHGLMPNEFTLGCVLKGCGKVREYELGVSVHCLAIKAGLRMDPFFGSSMLSLYSKLGYIEEAERVFADAGCRDVGCYNAMMGGYVECGYGGEAMRILSSMKATDVLLDECSFVSGFKGCALNGDLDHGRELHGVLIRTGMHSSIPTMNALIDMYLKNGDKDYGLKVFRGMRRTDGSSVKKSTPI